MDQGLYVLFLHRSLNISSYVLPIRALHRFLACGTQTSAFERNLSGFHCRVSKNIKRDVYWPVLIINTDTHMVICINRQLFKEINIPTLVSLYIMEVTYYVRKHHQFVDLNSNIHAHNTRRNMDIHIQAHNTDLYKRSVINMGTKLYNKLPGYIKEIDTRPLRRI